MKTLIRIALCASTILLVACGKPLDDTKEAAAGALFQASRGASSAPAPLADLYNAGLVTSSVKVSCPHGGSLTMSVIMDATLQLSYDLAYDNCDYDGSTSLKGTMHTTISMVVGTGTVSTAMHLTGRVELSGAISDFIEADVTETVESSALNAPTASVSVTLDGTVTTSSGTYTYANEVVVINGSVLVAAGP